MTMKGPFIIIFLIISSCSGEYNKRYATSSKTNVDSSLKLEGYWRLAEDDFVSMIIKKDSIFYPDQDNQASKYLLFGNRIIVFDETSHSDTFKYEAIRDTLELTIFDGKVQTYIKCKY